MRYFLICEQVAGTYLLCDFSRSNYQVKKRIGYPRGLWFANVVKPVGDDGLRDVFSDAVDLASITNWYHDDQARQMSQVTRAARMLCLVSDTNIKTNTIVSVQSAVCQHRDWL